MTPALSMRASVAATLGELAASAPDLMAVSADGRLIFRDFIARAPERHVDVGIAEATLVGVTAGIAHCGRRVVVASIASFLMRRAYEQILVDVGFDALPVTFIGIGGGLAYGTLGGTHHAPEDVALARLVPSMSVFAPADAAGAADAVRVAVALRGPAYVRIGSGEDPELLGVRPGAGEPRVLRDGEDLAIVSYGRCLHEALAAADTLGRDGVAARVIEVGRLAPFPGDAVSRLLPDGAPVLVVEEHRTSGGLGDLVTDMLIQGERRGFARLAIDGRPAPPASREELLSFYGIDRPAIVRAALRLLGEVRPAAVARRRGAG